MYKKMCLSGVYGETKRQVYFPVDKVDDDSILTFTNEGFKWKPLKDIGCSDNDGSSIKNVLKLETFYGVEEIAYKPGDTIELPNGIDISESGVGTYAYTPSLTFQYWYSKYDIVSNKMTIPKDTSGEILCTASYSTTSGDDVLIFRLIDNSLKIEFKVSGDGVINWGDGSETESITSNLLTYSHTYTSIGIKVVTLSGTNHEYTFSNSSLFNAHLPLVTSIGESAFRNCNSLSSVNYPLATSIGSSAFSLCYSLSSVNLPLVTSINRYAFQNCSRLSSINLPSLTSIGENAFYDCSSLSSINLPLVTSIGGSAFRNCYSLSSINLPLVTSIESATFQNCYSLSSFNLPLVTSIGGSAFRNCSSIPSINFPLVTSIGDYAFYDCYKVSSINLPLVTTISTAFNSCYNVSSVNIPSVTSFGTGAFAHCYALNSITLPDIPPSLGSFSINNNTILYVPVGSLPTYQQNSQWNVNPSKIIEDTFENRAIYGN